MRKAKSARRLHGEFAEIWLACQGSNLFDPLLFIQRVSHYTAWIDSVVSGGKATSCHCFSLFVNLNCVLSESNRQDTNSSDAVRPREMSPGGRRMPVS